MVNKWEEGKLYIFEKDVTVCFYSLDWNRCNYGKCKLHFVLLERPCSENVPKGLPSRPWGNFGKILLGNGEVCWVRLQRNECNIFSKKWLRNNNTFTS